MSQPISIPACPECNRQDAKPISVHDAYVNDPPQPGEKPIATVTVYLCPCGATYTQTIRHNQGNP
jgi:hypothetical protein